MQVIRVGVRLALLVGLFVVPLVAQSQISSTKGREFWFSFMENINPEALGGNGAQVTVYISSETATSGTISIPRRGLSQNFSVAGNSTTPINLTALGWGATVLGSNVLSDNGIRIETQDSVTVFALNYVINISDAAVVLPVQSLGNEYYAMTVSGTGDINRLSELAITASQPNTEIEITPSSSTTTGQPAGIPYTVTLQQGQVYQVQGFGDLAGTYIRAVGDDGCKPFAVYSGNKWQSICVDNAFEPDFGTGCVGGNHFMEPMLPVKTWGREYLTVPYASRFRDYIRVLASEDGTEIRRNGTLAGTLNRGEFLAFTTNQPEQITSSEPVMVCQFSQSQDNDNSGTGDPFMINISPVEQSITAITFNAFTAAQTVQFYVNLVTDSARRNELTFDGFTLGSVWQDVPGTGLSYAQLAITAGNHTVRSDAGFVAYVYAFGVNFPGGNNFEAYGYSAGFRSENLTLQANFSEDEICTGKPLFLSGETTIPTNEFFWRITDSGGTVVRNLTGQNVVTTLDQPGDYTVLLNIERTGVCTRDSVTRTIRVTSENQILTPDTTVCQGFFFPVRTVNQPPGTTYLWSPASVTSDPTSATPILTTQANQQYVVRVSTPDSCVYFDTLQVNVSPPITIDAPAARDTTVCVGEVLSFQGSVASDWFRDRAGTRTALASGTDQVLNVAFNTVGVDTIVLFDGVCDDRVRVRVINSPSINEALPPSLCTGDTRTFTSDFPGDWFLDVGGVETPLAANTLSSGPVTFTATGNQQVIIRGCSGQDQRVFNVLQSPSILPDVPDTTFCIDESGSFQAAIPGSWRLFFEGSQIQNYGNLAANTPVVIQPDLLSGRGRYDLVIDNGNCPDTLTIFGAIRTFDISTPNADASICVGDTLDFVSTEFGFWYLEQGASRTQVARVANRVDTLAFPNAGVFTVALENCGGRAARQITVLDYPEIVLPAVDSLAICQGESLSFASDLAGDWTQARVGFGPTTITTSATSTGAVPFPVAGVFRVLVNTGGCTDTVVVTVNPPPTVTPNALTRNVSCFSAGDAQAVPNVAGGLPPYSYSWNTGATTDRLENLGPGTYTLTVTDQNGCQSIETFVVTEPTELLIDSFQVDSTRCFETRDGAIRVFVQGGTPPYFVNGIGGTNLTGLGTGDYTVRVTDANNCLALIPSDVPVLGPPQLLLSPVGSDNNCGQVNSQATVLVVGGTPPYSFLWDDPTTSTDSQLVNIPAGVYTVRVRDRNNCPQQATITVLDIPGPTAEFNAEPTLPVTLVTGSATVRFINRSKRGADFVWDFGDGGSATDENPVYTYERAGTYTVTLTVLDPAGCEERFAIGPVEVIDQPVIEIPNVFTPNGDGTNDELVFQAPGVERFEIVITDRAGRPVFSSNTINQHWDGRLNGAEAPAGVYFFDFTVVYINGVEVRKTGSVTLVR